MRSTRILRFLFVLTALALPSGVAHAQRYWHDDQGRDVVRIDLWLPLLRDTVPFRGHRFFTGAVVPSTSIRVGEGIRFEADLPIMRSGGCVGASGAVIRCTTPSTSKQSSFRIGNPYLGVRIGDDAKTISGTLGARLPIGQNPKDAIGQLAVAAAAGSNYDDFEAFMPNIMTFRGMLEVHRLSKKGFLFGVRGGPSLQISTSGDPQKDSETSFDYGARMGYEGSQVQLGLALSGRYLLTAPRVGACLPVLLDKLGNVIPCDPKSFDNRTDHHLSGTMELRTGRVRPRATLRVPLDKSRSKTSGAVVGFGVSIAH
jgi:hypothetical protein